ncbi:MAG: type II toxin-antitoxin system mRNA interferase toxin, RelE/StbE family [Candidatus Vogelbacteria bacterium]|nr:type II toxin-antitoxin system mRNA interferase toxin, RelE/StbE family [Candidatus Vogelbacteria bacterium]
MIVIPSKYFEKQSSKLPKNVKLALAERLRLFIENSHNPLLNNHALHGSIRHYRSINITGDYRLVFELLDEGTVRLIDIDTHSSLYKN